MVKVYFESSCHAELVAIFEDEHTYNLCCGALEEEAEKHGMIVTESVEDWKDWNEETKKLND